MGLLWAFLWGKQNLDFKSPCGMSKTIPKFHTLTDYRQSPSHLNTGHAVVCESQMRTSLMQLLTDNLNSSNANHIPPRMPQQQPPKKEIEGYEGRRPSVQ